MQRMGPRHVNPRPNLKKMRVEHADVVSAKKERSGPGNPLRSSRPRNF